MNGAAIRVWAALLVVAAAGWGVVAMVDFRSDLGFLLPAEASQRTRFLSDRLADSRAQGVLLIAIAGGDSAGRRDASMALTDGLRSSGAFESVSNGTGAAMPDGFDLLFANRYLLGPAWDPDTGLSADAIRAALDDSLGLLGTTAGSLVRRYLPADPTGRGRSLLAALSPLAVPQKADGVWVSADRQTALLFARARTQAYDLDGQAALIEDIRAAFAPISQGGRYALLIAGPARFAVAIRDRIEGNVIVLSTVSLLLIMGLVWRGLRRPSLLPLLALPMGVGVLAGLAAVQAAFGFVHGITLAFGACLVGIAIDYPLHIVAHAADMADMRESARRIWSTLRLSALSTVAAFVPFLFARFPGLGQIGLFVVAGLLAGLLAARFLFPALCPGMVRHPGSQIGLQRLWRIRTALRLPLIGLTIAGASVLFVRWDTVQESDLQALSPAPPELVALDRKLRAGLGAPDVRYLIAVRAAAADEVLQREERLRPVLGRLQEEGGIAAYRMAADYLPSRGEQERRRALLPDAQTLRLAVAEAVAGTPYNAAAFEPFIADVAKAGRSEPVTRADLAGTPVAPLLAAYLDSRDGAWTGVVLLSGLKSPDALAEALRFAGIPGVEAIDLKQEANRLVRSFLDESLAWLALSLVAVTGLLYAGLRSADGVARVIGPVLLSLTVTAGTLAALGIPVSLFHILSLILVAGLGMDYGLFFARRSDDATTLRATILCNVTTAAVFLVMAFSSIPVLHGIGLTVAMGSFVALLATAAFAPPEGQPRA